MPVAIQADPSLPGFNSYSTVADFDSFHSTRLHNSAATSASTATKTSAILWASRQLDSLKWRGVRYSGTQTMAFPRRGLSYYETSDIGGFDYESVDLSSPGMGYFTKVEISDTTVPTFLRDACNELAFWLIDSDTTAPTGLEGMKRIKVDVIEIESQPNDREGWFTDTIRSMVWRFLKQSSKYIAATQRV